MAKDQQGKKLGLRIIQALAYVAEKVGCYKVSELAPESLCMKDSSDHEPDHPRLLRGE